MQAFKTDKEPTVDGEVIGDAVWQTFKPVDQLWQTKPNSGFPASEKTEIRIIYTSTTFYLSVVCYDKEPGKLVVSDARRDAPLDNTDSFLFILDTFHDRQNGFVFGTNPIGIEYDGQVDNEGQGNFSNNRLQMGTIGGFNLNWDAAWTVRSKTGDFGWSAEFSIPLRTLRFASGKDQVWGINFQRNIRKTNEIVFWAALPIQFDLKRLSLEGTLTGLDLQSPGNLKLIPYALGRAARDFTSGDGTTVKPVGGVDLKYSITPSVTLDLTYNTDFAQVEVDQQQVNLDRFNLFFPEKRPFFLENAGQFTVGSAGEVDLFFTRRIGLGNRGEVIPIIGGGRVSGKIDNTNIGFLNMTTRAVDEQDIEGQNFTVARVNQQIGQRSSIGGIIVNRQSTSVSDNYNRSFALDGKYGIGKKATISGYVAKTQTPGETRDQTSFKLLNSYEWNGLRATLGYTQLGEGFNPEVGYLFRSAYRKPEASVFQQVRMNGKYGLLELRPHATYRSFWNFKGFQETSYLHVDNHWVWVSGLEIHTGINFTTEGVTKPFVISRRNDVTVPVGTYDHREAQLVLMTNASKPFYISTRSILGGSFGGLRYLNTGTVGMRVGKKFNSELSLQVNDVRLPDGSFVQEVLAARVAYSFRPRINLQSFVQYNSEEDLWSFNIRFNILEQANTGLFLVYNDVYTEGFVRNRSFTVKYTHVFDLLKNK
ncbi:MAG: carbohydrate binding family 9 domain-containing protein [Bacteroidetes bacterium]|nr:carbohydrate binding family 9 domain-containing protein [Bacteroidota bacterium]